MIQDIAPHIYHVEFKNLQPKEEDAILVFKNNQLLIRDQDKIVFLQSKELVAEQRERCRYLFAVDEMRFFYLDVTGEDNFALPKGFRFAKRQEFRRLIPKHMAFVAVTAFQLDGWYSSHRFCGRCAGKLEHDTNERMLRCNSCDNRVYPRINPAVIVAVTSGEKILLTKYKGREYQNYALIAGFTEIGESFEDTVKREVMEEAGLKVKNIRYYASQPWAFADNILAGYFCEVDGEDAIRIDQEELSVADWIDRDKIPVEFTDSSLTNEMIFAFKNMKN